MVLVTYKNSATALIEVEKVDADLFEITDDHDLELSKGGDTKKVFHRDVWLSAMVEA